MKYNTVVILGSTPFFGPQLNDQRLANAFLEEGFDVHFVDPPRPLLRGFPMDLRPDTPTDVRIHRPWRMPRGSRGLFGLIDAVLTSIQVLWAVRKVDRDSSFVLICSAPPLLSLLMRRWMVVALIKDDYAAGTHLTGLNTDRIRKFRRLQTRRADKVVVVSTFLRDLLLREGVRSTVIPPGCHPGRSHGDEPDELKNVPGPRALFSGALSDRIDSSLLEATLDAGASLVLVGGVHHHWSERQDLARLLSRPGVVSLGHRTSDFVEQVAGWCDVGLIPYHVDEFNSASWPLKTLEYVAAGLPAVGTPLPALFEIDQRCVRIAASPQEFAQAVLAAADWKAQPKSAKILQDVARANSWNTRAHSYLQLIGQ